MSSYATVNEADAYFETRLHVSVWTAASSADKLKSLTQATRIIDRLAYAGEKHAAYLVSSALLGSPTETDIAAIRAAAQSQELEFPRGSDTAIPTDIKIATYEIALALLDGVDPDIEYQEQGVVSQGYSSVRVTYDRTSVQEHTNAGVPSPTAWRYLKPYCREAGGIKLSRVS